MRMRAALKAAPMSTRALPIKALSLDSSMLSFGWFMSGTVLPSDLLDKPLLAVQTRRTGVSPVPPPCRSRSKAGRQIRSPGPLTTILGICRGEGINPESGWIKRTALRNMSRRTGVSPVLLNLGSAGRGTGGTPILRLFGRGVEMGDRRDACPTFGWRNSLFGRRS
jgi:hypothetical protein